MIYLVGLAPGATLGRALDRQQALRPAGREFLHGAPGSIDVYRREWKPARRIAFDTRLRRARKQKVPASIATPCCAHIVNAWCPAGAGCCSADSWLCVFLASGPASWAMVSRRVAAALRQMPANNPKDLRCLRQRALAALYFISTTSPASGRTLSLSTAIKIVSSPWHSR